MPSEDVTQIPSITQLVFKVVRLSIPWKDCAPNDQGILEADIIRIGHLTVYLQTPCETALLQLAPLTE